ncbi:MAG: prolipoprotein diacylglyceryl transferase family protein [Bacteroidota bacterium]
MTLLFDFPVVFRLGSLALPAHLLFEVAAFFLGYRLYVALRGRQQDPISDEHRVWILIGAAAGAFVGSRVLGALQHPAVFDDARWWLLVFQSKTIVGGLLGGLIGVEATKKGLGVTRSSGDLFAYPLILAIAVGRVGCFLTGVYEPTYGAPTSLPWGLDLGDGIPRHPTALYEIFVLTGIALVLVLRERRRPFGEGLRFQAFMVAYLAWRLGIGFIQPGTPLLGSFTAIQLGCLGGLIYYARLAIRRRRTTMSTASF